LEEDVVGVNVPIGEFGGANGVGGVIAFWLDSQEQLFNSLVLTSSL